jgi:hypothetical protein
MAFSPSSSFEKDPGLSEVEEVAPRTVSLAGNADDAIVEGDAPAFRLYKRRFVGVVGLVRFSPLRHGWTGTDEAAIAQFLLNVAGGMSYPWFGPIANESELASSLASS